MPSGGSARARARAAATARVGLGGGWVDVVGIKAELVVNLAFLRVAEDFVGFGESLEFFLGGLVTGIDVGMVLAGELLESLADFFRGGIFLDAQGGVIVFVGG